MGGGKGPPSAAAAAAAAGRSGTNFVGGMRGNGAGSPESWKVATETAHGGGAGGAGAAGGNALRR
jgi:hypothetical protein